MAFRKVATNKVGGKFFAYGLSASGKSCFALTFPNSGAVDSETGLAFYENTDIEINGKKYNNLKLVDTTANLDDLENNLDAIISGEIDIETFIVDSETKFYNTMDIACGEVEDKKAKQKGREVDTRAKWGRVKQINMKLQQAKISASSKGIHVVSVAQAKEILEEKTNRLLGYAPESHKSLPYDYDVVLRFFTKKDLKTGDLVYCAEVIKDRTNVTKIGQIIENCTFDVWKDYFDKRNGLGLSGSDFSKDLKKSINSTLSEAELQEELAKEILEKIKSAGKTNSAKVLDKVKELELDMKALDSNPVESLKAMREYLLTL